MKLVVIYRYSIVIRCVFSYYSIIHAIRQPVRIWERIGPFFLLLSQVLLYSRKFLAYFPLCLCVSTCWWGYCLPLDAETGACYPACIEFYLYVNFIWSEEMGTMHLKTAAIQVNSRDNPAENLATVERLLDEAAGMGAQFASLPEFWPYLGPYAGFDQAAQTVPGPFIERLQEKARQYRMIVHAGSIVERHPKLPGKFYNTCVLINRAGDVVAKYRKIHLFDVNLANGEKHYESERIVPGDEIVTAEIDGITFGLTICYDLRFPELYRLLALRGAQIIMVPAGFTLHTGRDHWEVLLRARAIENLCYVVAPAQVGSYPPNKHCFGRSMIIDPWGLVLAQAPDVPGVIMAEINLEAITEARAQIPCLENRRPEAYRW